MNQEEARLKQKLHDWQIFFIVISAVIGNGIFYNVGQALKVSGPGGLLLDTFVVGALAICVMEGISEFVQLFPAPNAVVEYVKAFVDEDLSWIVGFAYWYTYSALFAGQNIAAAQHSRFWNVSQTWQTIAFYVFAPIAILAINFCGVRYYGYIEAVGGFLKVLLALGVAIFLFVIAGEEQYSPSPISDAFTALPEVAPNRIQAICYALPFVALSFLGVELVIVSAYEAKDLRALKFPSQTAGYVAALLYVLCVIGEITNVKWTNDHLPGLYGGLEGYTAQVNNGPPHTTSMVIIAASTAGKRAMAGFLNGCFIFSNLSAANTALYVASRTLYGLARDSPTTNPLGRAFRKLSIVEPWTGVPIPALIVSAGAFSTWLPFVQLERGYNIDALTEIIAVSASVSCLIVWAALSLAFIRYKAWSGPLSIEIQRSMLDKCDPDITATYQEYNRRSLNYKPKTLLRKIQPFPAYAGLVGSLTVIGFSTATWWSSDATFSNVAQSLGAPIVLAALWCLFKAINRRPWVRIGSNVSLLMENLDKLEWYKEGQDIPPRILQDQIASDVENTTMRDRRRAVG